MKRLICIFALAACLSFSVLAAPVKLDAIVNVRKEYNDTLATLQVPKNESNNNLTFAYLHWAVSPADYSVYLGLQYHCTDHALEDGMTGVEVRINDVLVGTVFADGTTENVDRDQFELEGIFSIAEGPPYEHTCEIRVGIKFWPNGEIVAGVRILDFSGNPSNYYRQRVYSPYTTTTKPSESTSSSKTTTEKSTTAKTTTTAKAAPATETTASTRAAVRTTAPIITASPKRETTATTAAVSVMQPTVVPSGTTAALKTTKPKTTKAAKEPAAKREKTTEPFTSETSAAAVVLPATTEPTGPPTSSAAASNAQMYRELNKAKIVGTVLAAVILTVAVMSAVFLGMRQKQEPQAHTPQEEYDDFG